MRSRTRTSLVLLALVGLAAALLVPTSPTTVGADTGEGTAPVAAEHGLVTGGGLHTCAVEDDGAVQCWGANDLGQLGNGTTAASTRPEAVLGITTARSVSAGNSHTCALIHDGSVRCWGNNGNGQLGNGTTSPPSPPALAPVTVVGLDDATAIAAGGFHTCALREDATVACWGKNGTGQLGDGTGSGTSYQPVAVLHDDDDVSGTDPVPIEDVIAITGGEYHSCAIRGTTGEVLCWGHNAFGQLGDGSADDRPLAVVVGGLPADDGHSDHDPHHAVALTAGEGHTCAVLDDGTARCWGHNYYGQLGNNTTFATAPDQQGTDSHTPVTVTFDADPDPLAEDIDPLDGIVSITAGQFHTCVRLAGGGGRCWGNNGRGQLGDALVPQQNRANAVLIDGLAGAVALTAGGYHTCALLTGGGMECWGYNFYGQLGSYRASSPTPVTVTAVTGATDVTTGAGHACARLTTPAYANRPVCWGANANGELGAGLTPSPADTTVAVDVASTPAVPIDEADLLAAGNDHTCALATGSQTPRCWGRNTQGQLGDGTNSNSTAPVAVSGITTATSVDAGGLLAGVEVGHSCALLADGGVRCWGGNTSGQLGDGTTTNRNAPVTVLSDDDDDHLNTPPPDLTPPVALTGASAISAGGLHACALLTSSRVRCWGENGSGQLGDGTTGDRPFAVTVDLDADEPDPDETEPKNFDPLTGVTQVAAGGRHTCALKSDDTLWCWGSNSAGQLGVAGGSRDVPVKAPISDAPVTIVDVTAGDAHTCARVRNLDDNTYAVCWGADGSGQLGDDAALADKTTPVSPAGLGAPGGGLQNIELVTSISAGRDNTCATLIDTTVSCWGDNTHGQLGDGVGQGSRTRVAVLGTGGVGGNFIPAPVDDTATAPAPGPPATPVVIAVLANDTDPDADTLTVTSVGTPAKGTATTDGTTVTYTPDADFCTQDPTDFTDTFDYVTTDGTASVPATVVVTVLCPNTPPVAGDVTVTVDEDATTVIDVLAEASDLNADPLLVQTGPLSDPPNGTATVLPDQSAISYTPDPDHHGADSFTFAVTDGADQSNVATVHITVTNINDPPVAFDDTMADTVEGVAVTHDVIGNDADADADLLEVFSVSDPPHGSAQRVSGTELRYAPDPGWCGADTFTYVVTDGQAVDTGGVQVQVDCVDDGPLAQDDLATTAEDTPVVIDVLANDSDPEGDPLTIVSVTEPAHGTATHDGTTVTYTPDPDHCGTDEFGYVVTDGTTTASATIRPVAVLCTNDPPVANDDVDVVAEDGDVLIDVLSNDEDVDGDALSVAVLGTPSNGTVVLASSNRIRYTPPSDLCGTIETFTYDAKDPAGDTDTATVSVTITCVNDAPVVAPIADTETPWGSELSVALTATDADVGDAHTFSLVSGPVDAAVVDVGGSFELRWTPTSSQISTYTIVVRTTDAGGLTDDGSVRVTVTKRPTTLMYTGAAAGQLSDAAPVSAVLVDVDDLPVAGAVVAFDVGGAKGSATTDTVGSAAASLVLPPPAAATTAKATYAGSAAYLPAQAEQLFIVQPEDLDVTFAGAYVTSTSGTSTPVTLRATIAEPADGTPAVLSGATVAFHEVGGGTLCTATVSGSAAGSATASCTTAALPVGSRAVVLDAGAPSHTDAVGVGAFAVGDAGTTVLGAGRVGSADHFAFAVRPAARKAPASGTAIHVYDSGGAAIVVGGAVGGLTTSCTKGKGATCQASISAAGTFRRSIDLETGFESILLGTASMDLTAVDASPDLYRVVLGAPDGHTTGPTPVALTAGSVKVG